MTNANGIQNCEFQIGQQVQKRRGYRGYKWPGTVVSIFKNLNGEVRLVVECTVPEVSGALHIYNASQLEKIE